MDLINVLFVVVLILNVFVVAGDTHNDKSHNDMTGNEQVLKEMLNAVKEQNRKLVLQNQRLQQVWLGMQQMCKALAMPTYDCKQTEVTTPNTSLKPDIEKKQINSILFKPTLPLKVLSIKSTGSISNISQINIIYVATPDHFVSWIGRREDGRTWRKGNLKTQTVQGSDTYTSKIDVENLKSIRTMFFRLQNDEQSIYIRLNTTAAETSQEQSVIEPHSSVIHINSSYMAPKNSDLTIRAAIKFNRTFIGDFSEVKLLFAGLNTSANPPTYFEIHNFISKDVSFNLSRRTDETSNFDITISHPFVKYGGFLTIHIPYMESSKDRMIDEFNIGPSIKILAYGSKEVIPYNAVGIMPLKHQTLIFPPSSSIICVAFGNPRPTAAIFKLDDNGGYSKLATENTFIDRYSEVEALSLSAHNLTNEGRYICRASNGDKSVELSTEAIIVREAVIDESKTGVMKNTSKTIVISCKAKGNPRPELDFRLYDEYGPFLIKSGLYKFWKSTSGKYTSRVTLTLSAVDDVDVHTVFCFATQGDSQWFFKTPQNQYLS